MININLISDTGQDGETQASTVLMTSKNKKVDLSEVQTVIVNVVLIALPAVLLYIYGIQNVSQIRRSLVTVNAKKGAIQKEHSNISIRLQAKDVIERDVQKTEAKLKILRKLSSTRLREVKALDILQNMFPRKAWVSSVKFVENTMELQGFSALDISLNEFVQKLERQPYFSQVLLLENKETKKIGAVYQTFLIKSSLLLND